MEPDVAGATCAPLPAELAALERLAHDAPRRARGENFPVALRVLPAVVRQSLTDIYVFARVVDEIGDGAVDGQTIRSGTDGGATVELQPAARERLRLLQLVELDLHAAATGTARLSFVRALGPALADGRLPLRPLMDLIAANRADQCVTGYRTFDDLLGYCALSAAPIGQLVLALAGSDDAVNTAASDQVCAALQVLEHCQDVGEDAAAGRVYLPGEELARAGVTRADLQAGVTTPELRGVVANQVRRAAELLEAGPGLVRRLGGWARVAVAGYVAGGLATARALAAADYDVLGAPITAGPARTLRFAGPLLVGAGRPAGRRVQEAYRHCERVTASQAKNFAWGIRLLPAHKRQALSAVYALARRIDDIGDGSMPAADKARALAGVRASLAEPDQHPDDPVLVAVADAAARLPIPLAAFGELIDGCEMDVRGRSYRTGQELVEYCRCVAGSIGRLSLGVFDPPLATADRELAAGLADALGVALQLTNILRDVREDLLAGRVYLPAEDCERYGCELMIGDDGRLDPQGGALASLLRHQGSAARRWYAEGEQLLPLLDRRSTACCAAMSGIYRELLDRLCADPTIVMRGRASLSGADKARIAVRALAGRHG